MKKFKYWIVGLILFMATFTIAGINDRMSPIELSDYTGNIVSEVSIALASLFVDGAGPILSSTAPDLTTVDNIGKVVYANSGETAEIHFPWSPSLAFAGLQVKVQATSSVNSGPEQAMDWAIIVNVDGSAIGTVIAQTGATFTDYAMDTKVDEITLTLNAAGVNAVTPGEGSVTVQLWNNGTSNGTLEITDIKVKELWKTN